MAAHAKYLTIRKPGIVNVNMKFTQPVQKALQDSLRKHGITESSVNPVDPTKADYTDVVLKLRREGADSIIAGLDPFSYQRLFQAMERQSWFPTVLGLGLDKASANDGYGKAADGAQSLTPVLEREEQMSQAWIK